MEHLHPEPLSYSSPNLALRDNGPGVVSLAFALLFPVMYALLRSEFSFVRTRMPIILLIAAIWAISGGVAVVFGLIGIVRCRRRHQRGLVISLIGLVLGSANCAAGPILHQYEKSRYWHRYGMNHAAVQCASNMRQIALATQMYANENQGRFPNRLEDLLSSGLITADTLRCPLSSGMPATANLSAVAQGSYIYLGKGMTKDSDSKCVLLYEPLKNHEGTVNNINFVFVDGRVETIARDDAEVIIAQRDMGTNPPKH